MAAKTTEKPYTAPNGEAEGQRCSSNNPEHSDSQRCAEWLARTLSPYKAPRWAFIDCVQTLSGCTWNEAEAATDEALSFDVTGYWWPRIKAPQP